MFPPHRKRRNPRVLGDGNGHDGDNTDPTDQQRNPAQRTDRHGQHIEDIGQGFEHLFLRDDGEILAAMPGNQALFDAGGNDG